MKKLGCKFSQSLQSSLLRISMSSNFLSLQGVIYRLNRNLVSHLSHTLSIFPEFHVVMVGFNYLIWTALDQAIDFLAVLVMQ